MKPRFRLTPAEWAFAALYASVGVQLIGMRELGNTGGAAWIGFVITHATAIGWCARRATPLASFYRDWLIVPAMLGNYLLLASWMSLSRNYEALKLMEWDQRFFGLTGEAWPEAWRWPVVTDVLSFAYVIFHPLIAYALWRHARRPRPQATAFLQTIGLLWGYGFLGYSLLPAAGPYLDRPGTWPLEGGWLTALNSALIMSGSNRVDCFPSLHCAVSGAILLFEWRRCRTTGILLTPLVIALWTSTLYLRQHYLVDVVAGALFLTLIWLRTQRLRRAAMTTPSPHHGSRPASLN